MKKFLEDLKRECINQNILMTDIKEILADYEEMYETALIDGYKHEQILMQFGDPKDIARDLAQDGSEKEIKPKENKTYQKGETQHEGYRMWHTFLALKHAIKVHVNLVSTDVIYEKIKGDEIHILIKGFDDVDRYTCTFIEHALKIHEPKRLGKVFLKKKDQNQIIIQVPQHIFMTDFNHSSIKSSVYFKDIECGAFNLNTISGDVKIEDANLTEVKLHTVSGDFTIHRVSMELCKVSQVSGDLKINNLEINESLKIDTVDGKTVIKHGRCNTLDFHSVSGYFKADEFYPNEIYLKSIAGDIQISHKKAHHIQTIKKSSISGKIKVNDMQYS